MSTFTSRCTSPGESDEYRRARDELLRAEIELRRQTEAVAAQRRKLPLGGAIPTDYAFDEWDAGANAARAVRLSELFSAPADTGQHPRHVNFTWPLWAVLDLRPEGRSPDWHPQLDYS